MNISTLALVLWGLFALVVGFDRNWYEKSKEVIKGKYLVHWKVQGEEIHLALEVKSHKGWIGFGIGESTSGGMRGSDIVTIEKDESGVVVRDRYSLALSEPHIDGCQDWIYNGSETENGDEIVQLVRKLNTQDPQDRAIVPGEMRILVAFGTGKTVSYHMSNRLASSLSFIDLPSPLPKDTQIVSLRFTSTVSSQQTSYMCQSFDLPSDQPYHAVGFIPVVQPENIKIVHHMLLHICPYQNTPENDYNRFNVSHSQNCNSPLGNPMGGCTSLFFAWAIGGGPFYLPEEAGYLVGPTGITTVVMEVHYNNVELLSGVTDHSGIDVILTKQLRKNDAANMVLGDHLVSNQYEIPVDTFYRLETECPELCTKDWPHEIHVFGDFLHMHAFGDSIWSTVYRDNNRVPGYLNRIEYWDYGLQQTTPMDIVLKPGDRIFTICNYDTSSATAPVRFGGNSFDEMCMEFIAYYPKLRTKAGHDYGFCGFAGITYQVNGTDVSVKPGPSTICGSLLDWMSYLDDEGKTFPNPMHIVPAGDDVGEFGGASQGCKATREEKPKDNVGIIVAGSLAAFVFCSMIVVAVAQFGQTRLCKTEGSPYTDRNDPFQ